MDFIAKARKGERLHLCFVMLVFRRGRAWALALMLAITAGAVGLILWTWSIGTFTSGIELAANGRSLAL